MNRHADERELVSVAEGEQPYLGGRQLGGGDECVKELAGGHGLLSVKPREKRTSGTHMRAGARSPTAGATASGLKLSDAHARTRSAGPAVHSTARDWSRGAHPSSDLARERNLMQWTL